MSDSEKNCASSVSQTTGPNTAGSPMMTPAIDGSSSSTGNPLATSQPSSGGNPTSPASSLSVQPQQHHHPHVYPSMYKDTTFTKIFVGGLPYHTSDNTLREYFEVFGDIEEAVVITDRQTAKSRGYGFVTMLDRSSAERACKEPNPIIDGRKANVNLAYLGAKPRTNGIAALHARAAAASYAPFLQSPLGYPSPYLYPSPILISPNLFLPNNGHHHHASHHSNASSSNTTNGGGGSPNSATSPPPANNSAQQSYYDFSTAAALAAAASSFVQQHQQYGGQPYGNAFGDPSALYNFAPYAAAAGLLQNGGFGNGGLMHHQNGSTQGSTGSSNSSLYNGGAMNGHHMPVTVVPVLRGEK